MHDTSQNDQKNPSFRSVPMTGVIYVTTKAVELGFFADNPEWANLGQGAPETASVAEGGTVTINASTDEYAPVAGLHALRDQVATMYNELYRQEKDSKYTAENVAICSGGRLALTRIAAALGNIHVGHCIPDYTAYEELLTVFKTFTPIPLLVHEDQKYTLSANEVEKHIIRLGLGAILLSNPCNPTGQHIKGEQLQRWVDICNTQECTGIFDEFYSHYVYEHSPANKNHNLVSAAEYVHDVNNDRVIIVDGLTKNWRKPGWRISWTLGPKDVIDFITSAGSFLDGGAPHPLQEATIPLLDYQLVIEQSKALQGMFHAKRDFTLQRLQELSIEVSSPPQGAFYCWANLERLPEPLRDGMKFFEEGLKEKVITVPGEFFDVNPGKRRSSSAYKNYARISFGPSMETLTRGFDALERVIAKNS